MGEQQLYLVGYELVGQSLDESQAMGHLLEKRFHGKKVLPSTWVIRFDGDAFMLGGRIMEAAAPVFSEKLGHRIFVVPMKDNGWLLLNSITSPRFF